LVHILQLLLHLHVTLDLNPGEIFTKQIASGGLKQRRKKDELLLMQDSVPTTKGEEKMANQKRRLLQAMAVTVLVVGFSTSAFAWNVQEHLTNLTGQNVNDLTKIVISAGGVTDAITNDFGAPTISNGILYDSIHWGPGADLPPGGTTFGCFNVDTAGPVLATSFWTNDGVIVGLAGVEVTVVEDLSGGGGGDLILDISNDWVHWGGTVWPAELGDDFGPPVGPIALTDVFYAYVNISRPMEELNADLNTDPSITWQPLPNMNLGSGAQDTFDLGIPQDDVVLFRFVAAGAGLSTPTIHQFGEPVVPVMSPWATGLMLVVLTTMGMLALFVRRHATA
jgi:hypothetical protein